MNTAQPEQVRRNAWRAIGLFLILTTVFTCVFGGFMGYQGGTPSLLVTGVMWSPGMAAILTCLILKRPVASLPWAKKSAGVGL